jgi:hypothetical protein
MDIPGLDMLSSDPEAVIHRGWMTAAMPSSAAILHGRRRVMTEVSDFSQRMGGRGPADLAAMQAAAAWQAAWGVTDFTLYYQPNERSPKDYRAYCSFVGRLNAVLKPARRDPDVLLYYPIFDLWAEYRPVAEPLSLASQTKRCQAVVRSFERLGQTLQRRQIVFSLVDHEMLASARVESDGRLRIAEQSFGSLVLPAGIELPDGASSVVERFRGTGGRVVNDSESAPLAEGALCEATEPRQDLAPPSDRITLGRFVRDGRTILLAVNVGRERYEGCLRGDVSGVWRRMDPASGNTGAIGPGPGDGLPLSLAPREAVLLVNTP